MPAEHQPKRGNWRVLASWRESRRLVCWVTKTCFGSSAVVFGSFFVIKHVWYYLVSSFRLVCGGHLKNCQQLKTIKNYQDLDPAHQPTKCSLLKPSGFVTSVCLRRAVEVAGIACIFSNITQFNILSFLMFIAFHYDTNR